MSRPTLRIREWSTVSPASPADGALLRGLRLTAADHELLAELEGRSSIRLTELRSGLGVSVGPHIGSVSLSSLRIVIMPKIGIDSLMRMVEYAFNLSDLNVMRTPTTFATGHDGLIDLLGVSLLREVERIARGGLLPDYQARTEDLATLRGRLDLRHIATHPRQSTLRPHRRPPDQSSRCLGPAVRIEGHAVARPPPGARASSRPLLLRHDARRPR